MRNSLLPAFALVSIICASRAVAAPVLVTASAPSTEPASGSFAQVDAVIAEANRAMQKLQDCWKIAAAMRADLKKKKADLAAEFGTIPSAFDALLNKKSVRFVTQEQMCNQWTPPPGLLFAKAHDLLRSFQPKSTPGIAARVKQVAAKRTQYNLLIRPQAPEK
jgi:hypothetical protein